MDGMEMIITLSCQLSAYFRKLKIYLRDATKQFIFINSQSAVALFLRMEWAHTDEKISCNYFKNQHKILRLELTVFNQKSDFQYQ